jgi:hypothetical protein
MRLVVKNRRAISGQAMVEAAIALPLFLLLVFIIIETALLMNAHSLLRTAVFGGCRRLAMEPALSPLQLKAIVAQELLPVVRRDPLALSAVVPGDLPGDLRQYWKDQTPDYQDQMLKSLWSDLACHTGFEDAGKMARVSAVYTIPPLFPFNGLLARVLNRKVKVDSGKTPYFRLAYSVTLPAEAP